MARSAPARRQGAPTVLLLSRYGFDGGCPPTNRRGPQGALSRARSTGSRRGRRPFARRGNGRRRDGAARCGRSRPRPHRRPVVRRCDRPGDRDPQPGARALASSSAQHIQAVAGSACLRTRRSAPSSAVSTTSCRSRRVLWGAVPYLYAPRTRHRHAPLIGEDIARRLEHPLDPSALRRQHASPRLTMPARGSAGSPPQHWSYMVRRTGSCRSITAGGWRP